MSNMGGWIQTTRQYWLLRDVVTHLYLCLYFIPILLDNANQGLRASEKQIQMQWSSVWMCNSLDCRESRIELLYWRMETLKQRKAEAELHPSQTCAKWNKYQINFMWVYARWQMRRNDVHVFFPGSLISRNCIGLQTCRAKQSEPNKMTKPS